MHIGGDHKTNRTAMLEANRFSIVKGRDEGIVGEEFIEWDVGCPAVVVAISESVFTLRLESARQRYDVACGDTFPDVTETRPPRNAMKIRKNPHGWKLLKLIVG